MQSTGPLFYLILAIAAGLSWQAIFDIDRSIITRLKEIICDRL